MTQTTATRLVVEIDLTGDESTGSERTSHVENTVRLTEEPESIEIP